MDERIVLTLSSLGLTNNEIKIYLDVLKNDGSSALEISKRTEIYRSNVYSAVDSLISRGLIIEVFDEKRRILRANNPEAIEEYFKQKQTEAKEIIPMLRERMGVSEKSKTEITIAQGMISVRQAIMDLLEFNETIYVAAISKEALEVVSYEFLEELHKRRIAKKIPMRTILTEKMTERLEMLNKMPFTEARYFSDYMEPLVSLIICGEKVLLGVYKDGGHSIIIRDKSISEFYKNYFDLLWNKAKKI